MQTLEDADNVEEEGDESHGSGRLRLRSVFHSEDAGSKEGGKCTIDI